MAASRVDAKPYAGGAVVQLSQARTHFGRALYRVSSYVAGDLLVDTGPRHTRERLLRALRGRRLETVVVTHAHEDHVGNAAAVREATGAAVHASREAIGEVEAAGRPPLYRRHTWGSPDAGRLEVLPRRISTREHSFEVVATPGHTPADVSLVEPAHGWAFTGDLFLSPRQVVTMRPEDVSAQVVSLERVASYEPRVLFTGMRVFEDGAAALHARLVFLRQVMRDGQALRQAGLTEKQVRRKLLGREPWIHYWSGGEFGKGHFARQLLQAGAESDLGTTGEK